MLFIAAEDATMDSLKQDQSVGRLTNSTACPTCHGLDRSKVDPKKLTRFHALRQTESWSLAVSFDELAVGSTSGCQFCDILIQTFEHYWKNSTTSLHTSNPSVTLSVPLKENLDLAASFDAPNPRPFYAGVEELAIDVVLTTPEKCMVMFTPDSDGFADANQTCHYLSARCGLVDMSLSPQRLIHASCKSPSGYRIASMNTHVNSELIHFINGVGFS